MTRWSCGEWRATSPSSRTFAEIEGWAEDDHAAAFGAFLRSCRGRSRIAARRKAALALGDAWISGQAARAFFEDGFCRMSIAESSNPGFVTGYYEPEIEGSYVRGGPFQVPVYRRPDDLITLAPETERARFNDRITGMRQTADGQVPYYTRAEIWAGALAGRGLELLYLTDPVELFYMQVQGSGLVRLSRAVRSGSLTPARTGTPTRRSARLLIERGAIAPDAMSMAAVKAWLRADRGSRTRAHGGEPVLCLLPRARRGRGARRSARRARRRAHAGAEPCRRYRLSPARCCRFS